MAPTFTMNDIPTESEADTVVSDYEADGCTATKEQQPDGKWKVVAECPDG